ncbi:MAG TPA: methyltransferase domain-containing protein [Pseudonocardiaceae bacterium]|jgi:phospholipid N-methyltransferase|nr:methyltransferase domain-containing protein [Pseudonocardiaceae bacterium]
MTRQRLADATVFLREFVRAPLLTASVVPSSRVLADHIAAPVPLQGDPVVVELGPGTGTITSAIQRRLGGRGRHLAVELNPRLAAVVQQRCPEVEVICADVAELPGILAEHRLTADVIVSALPWAALRTTHPRSLPSVLADVLTEDGVLCQLGYAATRWAPPARRQLVNLRLAFEQVQVSPPIWRNLPPALTYLARCPRRQP